MKVIKAVINQISAGNIITNYSEIMDNKLKIDYFYGVEADQYAFLHYME